LLVLVALGHAAIAVTGSGNRIRFGIDGLDLYPSMVSGALHVHSGSRGAERSATRLLRPSRAGSPAGRFTRLPRT